MNYLRAFDISNSQTFDICQLVSFQTREQHIITNIERSSGLLRPHCDDDLCCFTDYKNQ